MKDSAKNTAKNRGRKSRLDENGEERKCFICPLCREMAEPEMVAWYGTNEYNWEKLPDPPKFEPTKCHKCGKVINLAGGGYSSGKDGYTCSDCFDFKL